MKIIVDNPSIKERIIEILYGIVLSTSIIAYVIIMMGEEKHKWFIPFFLLWIITHVITFYTYTPLFVYFILGDIFGFIVSRILRVMTVL